MHYGRLAQNNTQLAHSCAVRHVHCRSTIGHAVQIRRMECLRAEDVQPLARLTALRDLELLAEKSNGNILGQVASIVTLTRLCLMPITVLELNDVVALGPLTELVALSLSLLGCADRALSPLTQLPALRSLVLDSCSKRFSLTDEQVADLGPLTQLQWLSLRNHKALQACDVRLRDLQLPPEGLAGTAAELHEVQAAALWRLPWAAREALELRLGVLQNLLQLRSLHRLDVTGCRRVSPLSLKVFEQFAGLQQCVILQEHL